MPDYPLKRLSQVFKALANHRRMMIIKLLAKRSLSVVDIADRLGMTIKVCSFHLLKLEREGVLHKTRKGKFNLYAPTDSFKSSGIFRQINRSY